MKLLESLAAGVTGAENGSVRLYVRGTSTAATWYSDFEGTEANSSGAAIDLDSNGAAEVYVNRLVTVSVYTDAGTVLKSFTAGEAAGGVEYQGVGFTGTNYETALTGAGSGYATTLQAILDLAYTAFGAPDWKVDVNGTGVNIGAAVAGFAGMFFNVMDPTYGATGDSTTNDQPAIAAALAACSAAGGGIVFFPFGTYRITSVLNIPAGVSLMGSGSSSSLIVVDHASANGLRMQGATLPQFVTDLGVYAGQANSGSHILIDAACSFVGERLNLGSGAFSNGPLVTASASTSTVVSMRDCIFRPNTGSTANTLSSVSSARIQLSSCEFVAPATHNPANGVVYANSLFMDRCRFTNSACTSGTFSCVAFNSTTVNGSLTGCEFTNAGGATVTGMTLGTYIGGSFFSETGSVFGTSITAYSYSYNFGDASDASTVCLNTRDVRVYEATVTSATEDLPATQYGIFALTSTRAGNMSFTFNNTPPAGSRTLIAVVNDDGSSRDFTIGPLAAFATLETRTIGAGQAVGATLTCVRVDAASNVVVFVGGWSG